MLKLLRRKSGRFNGPLLRLRWSLCTAVLGLMFRFPRHSSCLTELSLKVDSLLIERICGCSRTTEAISETSWEPLNMRSICVHLNLSRIKVGLRRRERWGNECIMSNLWVWHALKRRANWLVSGCVWSVFLEHMLSGWILAWGFELVLLLIVESDASNDVWWDRSWLESILLLLLSCVARWHSVLLRVWDLLLIGMMRNWGSVKVSGVHWLLPWICHHLWRGKFLAIRDVKDVIGMFRGRFDSSLKHSVRIACVGIVKVEDRHLLLMKDAIVIESAWIGLAFEWDSSCSSSRG